MQTIASRISAVATHPKVLAAQEIIRAIENQGGTALMVGGFVRDLIMGLPGGDIDIATNIDPLLLAERFRLHDVGKNKEFNIMVASCGGFTFEIARFRSVTRFNTQGVPISLENSATFTEDAARRDFTINAMAMDGRWSIYDPFGGQDDIHRKVIRCVGNARERMEEDPLRAMRAVRFSARFGFEMEKQTATAVREFGPRLALVAVERVTAELLAMASFPGPVFAGAVRLMAELDLLRNVLPEVEVLRGLEHNPQYHPEGGVFSHVLAALSANEAPEPSVNLAILLHDVGKAVTRGRKNGRPTYHGHDRAGVKIIESLAVRLGLSRELRDALIFTTAHHMQAIILDRMRPSKVARLVANPHWPLLKQVVRGDTASRGKARANNTLERIFTDAEEIVAARPPGPVITGRRVMELTGLSPGPAIGRIMTAVTAWALDNRITDTAAIEMEARSRAKFLLPAPAEVREHQ